MRMGRGLWNCSVEFRRIRHTLIMLATYLVSRGVHLLKGQWGLMTNCKNEWIENILHTESHIPRKYSWNAKRNFKTRHKDPGGIICSICIRLYYVQAKQWISWRWNYFFEFWTWMRTRQTRSYLDNKRWIFKPKRCFGQRIRSSVITLWMRDSFHLPSIYLSTSEMTNQNMGHMEKHGLPPPLPHFPHSGIFRRGTEKKKKHFHPINGPDWLEYFLKIISLTKSCQNVLRVWSA